MAEVLALRHEAANLAGFANFAEYSLATKMARDPDEVLQFLRRLARLSRPAAEREYKELETFAGRKLDAWDVPYYSEQLKRARLDVSEEALRPYFPLPRVLAGLFAVASRLYRIRIVARSDIHAYHPDVRYFDILDRDGTPRGGFFLDLYARSNKRGGAWMDECVGRLQVGQARALPIAYLVCNFAPPVGARPSLLTHHDVLTVFHEFGHGLHHMLTRVNYPSVAGINGVPWDAVELPSQFMENFAWRSEVLPLISSHVDTGEALPLAHARAAAGDAQLPGRDADGTTARVRRCSTSGCTPSTRRSAAAHCRDAGRGACRSLGRARAGVQPLSEQLSARFSGGYAAGYYSYKWAEVLSADAFGAFEEHGIYDVSTARRFLQAILERGGSRDAMEPSSSSAAADPRSNRCCASSVWRPDTDAHRRVRGWRRRD
jgi:oligopeptidase A